MHAPGALQVTSSECTALNVSHMAHAHTPGLHQRAVELGMRFLAYVVRRDVVRSIEVWTTGSTARLPINNRACRTPDTGFMVRVRAALGSSSPPLRNRPGFKRLPFVTMVANRRSQIKNRNA
jgi:hypothetical protein